MKILPRGLRERKKEKVRMRGGYRWSDKLGELNKEGEKSASDEIKLVEMNSLDCSFNQIRGQIIKGS